MANDADITFTIGFDVDKEKQKDAFNKMSSSFTNYPLAKLSRPEKKELDSFVARHNEEIANQHLKRFLNTPEKGVGLLAKANKYRNEQDAISKLMGVGSFPTAPAADQYLSLKQFKENNAKEQEAFEAKLSAIASSIDDSIAPSADKKINDMMKERGINEGLLAKAERVKTASSIDDFIAPLADNRIDNAIKTKEEEMSKLESSLDETIGKQFEERINSIQTPSGTDTKEEEMSKLASSLDETIGKSFEERINSIKTPSDTETKETDGGLNAFEDRNRAYLNLLKQRKDAKKKYDESGDIDALKEYTSADQQLKALKDQEKEKKNNAKEEKGSIIRFGKMLATLHLVKKVLSSIKDIWKRLSDTELKVTQRDVKEKGFFSVDSYSAMHANVDRSHAVISRGLGYMGAAAPFSMEAFDSVLQQLQDLNLKAISGQGIADDQLVISLQRLSDTLGMGFNIKDILTDPNLNLTEFLTGLMNSVEKFLPKLNSLDDIKKSLVTNDIIKALGPELANALVYNYNYNQRTGGTSTVMEQVTSKGTNAYGLIDYTEEAKKFTDALASSRSAVDDFKVSLASVFAPTGKKVVDKGTQLASEGTMLINSQESKSRGLNYLLQYGSFGKTWLPFTNAKKDSKEQEDWFKQQKNKEIAAEKLKGAKDLNDIGDILDYAFYNPTALAAGTSTTTLEQSVGFWKASNILDKINGKKYSDLKPGDLSLYEQGIVNKLYKGKKDDWVFEVNDSNYKKQLEKIRKAMDFMFDEGGLWDTTPDVNPKEYAKRILGDEEYIQFIAWLLSEKNNILQEAGLMKKEGGFGYYTTPKYDEQGNKIGGTITIQIIDANNNYHNIPTTIEDGMLKAMVNVPSLQ